MPFNIIVQRVYREISVAAFQHLHSLSLKFHLNRQTGGLGRIIDRATKSLELISQFLMMTIFPSIIETIFLSILLWLWYSPWCSAIIVAACSYKSLWLALIAKIGSQKMTL